MPLKRMRCGEDNHNADFTIRGQLSMLTHVLHTEPECVLVEICTSKDIKFIMIRDVKNFVWLKHLTIGHFYIFSNLKCVILALKNVQHFCYEPTQITSFNEIDPNPNETFIDPPNQYFDVIKGSVTEADDELGVYNLSNSKLLVLSPLKFVARMPSLKVGDEVIAYNVHVVSGDLQVPTYVTCCRSFLYVEGRMQLNYLMSDPYEAISPSLRQLYVGGRNLKNILWLKKCKEFLKMNFPDEFLQTRGITSDGSTFRSSLLNSISQYVMQGIHVESTSLLQEVMVRNHKCDSLGQCVIPYSLCGVKELASSSKDTDKSGDPFWEYKLQDSENKLIVCFVSYKNTCHSLVASDASGSIQYLTMSSSPSENLIFLKEKVILISKHNFIEERFVGKLVWNYIHCKPEHITVIYPLNLEDGSSSTAQENSRRVNDSTLKSRNSDRQLIYSKANGTPLEQYLPQLIFVIHKSSFRAPEKSKPPRCTLLASLIGNIVPQGSSSDSLHPNRKNPTLITLQGPLLFSCHFIHVNNVYEIRIPSSISSSLFKQLIPPNVCTYTFLPDGLILPDDVEIYLMNSPIPSTIQRKGCYSVRDAVQDAPYDEFINIIGYISNRVHELPRFARELESVNAYGFGTPECKIITLYMCDELNDYSTIAVFLSNWNRLKYPLGLVPGAKVIVQYVKKVKPLKPSATNKMYFRASVFSAVEVVSLPSSSELSGHYQWGPRCVLNNVLKQTALGWISVSMMTLYSFTISTQCSACSSKYLHGTCSYVGCNANAEPKIFSQASILIQEFPDTRVIVYIPDKFVQSFLKIPSNVWKSLAQLTKSPGELQYKLQGANQESKELNFGSRVLHVYCASLLHGRRVHLLCRRFQSNVYKSTASCPVKILFCEAFQEVETYRSVLV